MTKDLIYIFLGGGTGSVLRYCVQLLMHERIVSYTFPWATFAVNIIGSFLIGFFYALSTRFNLSPEIRLLLTAGFCGGFTTFSTFSNDGMTLLKEEFYGTFALYYHIKHSNRFDRRNDRRLLGQKLDTISFSFYF